MLLDSHALLWWLTDNPRLSATAAAAIADADNDIFVSACVGYEIMYKQTRGRLPPLPESLSRRLQREGFAVLPVSLEQALAAAALPPPHRDPWDRIMMAQALDQELTVVTLDPVFAEYGVAVLW